MNSEDHLVFDALKNEKIETSFNDLTKVKQVKGILNYFKQKAFLKGVNIFPFCFAPSGVFFNDDYSNITGSLFNKVEYNSSHCNVLIVSGSISIKMASVLVDVYNKMPAPKWVISFGAAASSGAAFKTHAVIPGLSSIIPVDIYVPGDTPTIEALNDSLEKLKARIERTI